MILTKDLFENKITNTLTNILESDDNIQYSNNDKIYHAHLNKNEVRCEFSRTFQIDNASSYDIIMSELFQGVSYTIIDDIVKKIKEIGNNNEYQVPYPKNIFKKLWVKIKEKIYGKNYVKIPKYSNQTIIDTINKSLINKPLNGSNSFIVCGKKILSEICNYIKDKNNVVIGTYEYVGNIDGIDIIIDHNMEWDNTDVYVGKKSNYESLFLFYKNDVKIGEIVGSTLQPIKILKFKYHVGDIDSFITKIKFKF